jgi:hypothetical protein
MRERTHPLDDDDAPTGGLKTNTALVTLDTASTNLAVTVTEFLLVRTIARGAMVNAATPVTPARARATAALPTFPSAEAVIQATPEPMPVATPSLETVATVGVEDAQVSARLASGFPAESLNVALSVWEAPAAMSTLGATTVIRATAAGAGGTTGVDGVVGVAPDEGPPSPPPQDPTRNDPAR